jgi:hypothetical protein
MNQEPFVGAAVTAAPSNHTGTRSIFDLAAVIDARPVGRFQVWVLVLIGCSVTMDGFDLQSMGFVAPALVRAWGISAPGCSACSWGRSRWVWWPTGSAGAPFSSAPR